MAEFKIQIVMLKQDEVKKCTAAKLARFNLAKQVTAKALHNTIILDPFAKKFLFPQDKALSRIVTAIDCSWNLADSVFSHKFIGLTRKLPPLFAGNPVNYAKINKLTTAEALSAALHILGDEQKSYEILNKFKWGHTFLELNQNLLKEYSQTKTESDIIQIMYEYNIISRNQDNDETI